MITQFFGTTGMGKSANLARIIEETYYKRGDIMLELCREQIEADNKEFGLNCPYPDRPPIFVGPYLDVKFEVDFEEFFEPYFLSPYHLGLYEEGDKEAPAFPVQFFPPHSMLVIPEGQRYFDSRQGIHPRVSAFFEKHRHQHLDILIESQRPDLIDLNIRRLTHKFVEMRGIENETNFAGRVDSTTWNTRIFENWNAVNGYLNGKEENYRNKTEIHDGNIFSIFDSFACRKEFIPGAQNNGNNGKYNYLDSYAQAMMKGFPKGFEEYYKLTAPKGYWKNAV